MMKYLEVQRLILGLQNTEYRNQCFLLQNCDSYKKLFWKIILLKKVTVCRYSTRHLLRNNSQSARKTILRNFLAMQLRETLTKYMLNLLEPFNLHTIFNYICSSSKTIVKQNAIKECLKYVQSRSEFINAVLMS